MPGITFANFTDGGTPDDACAFVGYKNPVQAGASRQWTAGNVAAYILAKSQAQGPWQPNLTAVAGATSNCLAAIPSVNLPVVSTFYQFVNSAIGGLQGWQLVAYTGQAGFGTQLPNDHNGLTNNKIWIQVQ